MQKLARMLVYLYKEITAYLHKEQSPMTYQILKNGILVKTVSAKGMNSIYTQFNNYAKKRNGTLETRVEAIGSMVWILPNQDVLSLFRV